MFFSRSTYPPGGTRLTFCLGLLTFLASSGAAQQADVQLKPRRQNLMRVRIEMEVQGNVNVPNNPLVSRESELTLPIESDALFDYEERYLQAANVDARSDVPTIERYYHEATSNSELNRKISTIDLRESVRQVHVRRDALPETIYAVEDYFTGDELALLRIPVSSSAVDGLLPEQPVGVGDKIQMPEDAIVSLLNLTSVEANEIQLEVIGIESRSVKMKLSGKVEGSVEGVPTTIRTVGKLNFDRRIGTCTWLAIALHETREIGKAEPGFDVAATIKMVRQPLAEPVALPAAPAGLSVESAVPQDRLYVDLQSDHVGVGVLLDRRWRLMTDVPGSAMLRMIENDRSIAQCNLKPLVALEAGKQLTLEAFQQDVRRTLGERFSQMIEAEQRVSAMGLRVLRVVAAGAVEGVPIQWTMLHFSDDSGRRVLATFTMSSDSIAAFAGADVQFADSLRLLNRSASDGVAGGSIDRARVAQLSEQRIGEPRKLDADADDRVQSPSDLR